MIDTCTNSLIGQIGGFRETQGPGGVLVDNLGQLWASDGNSTVKVIDLLSRCAGYLARLFLKAG